MSYVKLEVRSGGIYIKQKKGNLPIDRELSHHPENEDQKALFLLRETAIKGLFSYLMGETQKIKNIEQSSKEEVKKLNSTLDKIIEVSTYKKISEPHVSIFFERKDIHRKQSQIITASKVNLWQHTFETADPTLKLLYKPLSHILYKKNFESLGIIHKFFKDNIIKNDTEKYKNLKNRAKKLTSKLDQILPESKLKEGIKTALNRISDNKPISFKVIELIEEVCSLCTKNQEFYKKIENSPYGKFSIFTDLKSTKQWVNTKYHTVVRGAPSYIACVDFDIYLSQRAFEEIEDSDTFTWDELVNKLKAGPNIARWGEGGVVFINYNGLTEMGRGYDKKDPMFIEIQAFRNAGMKIPKYEWEQSNDQKTSKEL